MTDPVELSHRRRLWWALVAAAAAAISALVYSERPLMRILAECEAIVRQCFAALLRLSPLELLPIALLVGGTVYAVGDFVLQRRRLRRALFARARRRPTDGEPIHALAAAHGLLDRVILLEESGRNPAFAAGLISPRIYLAANLQDELSAAELRALFRHEAWHVHRRDPLRFATLRLVAKFFFWMPIVRVLADDLIEEAELLADDFAAEMIDPTEVAGAVVKVARRASSAVAGVAAARGLRPIERRIRRLLGEKPAPASVLPRREALISASAVAALWALLAWMPAPAVAFVAGGNGVAHCPLCADSIVMGEAVRHDDCHLFM